MGKGKGLPLEGVEEDILDLDGLAIDEVRVHVRTGTMTSPSTLRSNKVRPSPASSPRRGRPSLDVGDLRKPRIDLNQNDWPLTYNKLKEEAGNEEKLHELHSVEFLFKNKEIPPWQSQLTLRALVVSCAMGAFLTIFVVKMDLMLGLIPPVNLFAGFFGFLIISTWTNLLSAAGLMGQPFTRQENAVIQVCVNAITSVSYNGGFATYLIAMSDAVAKQFPGPVNANDMKNPSFGWMTMFLLLSSSAGLFTMLPLRKFMIIDKKLTFPTGSASANFINSFHAPRWGKLNGRRQTKKLNRFFTISFLWSIFQWLYTGGDSCGFTNFPTFGLKAFQRSFYFDFYSAYIGIGMMCPFVITYSQLLGAILSSGILWPYIETKSGDWYPAEDAPTTLSGPQAYNVFIGLSIIIGGGVYNLIKIIVIGLTKHKKSDNSSALPVENPFHGKTPVPCDEEVRTKTFLKDQILKRVAIGGYVTIAIISVAVLSFIFPSLKWYQVLTLYLISPLLGFCRAYVTGLTDMSISMFYRNPAILIFGSWAGKSSGSVLVGLAACGILMNFVGAASNMMESFKLGYMTLSSPKSLFLSQLIGTIVGCLVSPHIFLYCKNHYPNGFGTPDSVFAASWASGFRDAAMRAANGLSTLPKHCLSLSLAFFFAAILVSLLRDLTPKKWKSLIPIPMAFAVPFNVGAYLSIDMCVGYLVFYLWRRKNEAQAKALAPFVGSALMFGDGLWMVDGKTVAESPSEMGAERYTVMVAIGLFLKEKSRLYPNRTLIDGISSYPFGQCPWNCKSHVGRKAFGFAGSVNLFLVSFLVGVLPVAEHRRVRDFVSWICQMINGVGGREESSVVAPPDPLDARNSKADGDGDGDSPPSQYSSCGESEFERYCSANSVMGTPSLCSSVNYTDCLESEFGSFRSSGFGDDGGLEGFSLGGKLERNFGERRPESSVLAFYKDEVFKNEVKLSDGATGVDSRASEVFESTTPHGLGSTTVSDNSGEGGSEGGRVGNASDHGFTSRLSSGHDLHMVRGEWGREDEEGSSLC
ncbi:hypothetical protein NL676_028773 [Syzygium grande]|nr:hypothetical protein NL676_028773 [Syzygium grande]